MEGNSTTPKNCVLTIFLHERNTIFFLVFSLIRFWIFVRNEYVGKSSLWRRCVEVSIKDVWKNGCGMYLILGNWYLFFPLSRLHQLHLILSSAHKHNRVTWLEQLSVAEFSGEKTRLKVYEYGHKKVLGIWLDLVLKVKYSKILIFKVIFLCQKSAEFLQFFFHQRTQNEELTFIINIFW